MELISGYPFWLIHDGLPFQYKKLLEDTRTSVVIIGGGISGALAAYYLTKFGIGCVLVDGRTIGMGSTCASTSLIQYELDEPLHKLTEKIGRARAFRAYQLSGESIDHLREIVKEVGHINCEDTPSVYFSTHRSEDKFIQRECKARREAGFDVELLSASSLFEEFGMDARTAILSQKGMQLNAYRLTHDLLQFSIKNGLRVYDRTLIKKTEYRKDGVVLKTDEGFHIRADKMVNCTGYEVLQFISKDIVDFYCTYAVASENQQENEMSLKKNAMFWATDNPYLYIRQTRDNRIIAGGRDERFSNRAFRRLYDSKSKQLTKDFRSLFPGTCFKAEFAWGGTFGKTRDSLPYIGTYDKTPHVYYGLGFGGNGISFSVIAAQIICDLLLGNQNPDAGLFSFERKR